MANVSQLTSHGGPDASQSFKVGVLDVNGSARRVETEGESATGLRQRGADTRFRVTGPDGLAVVLADTVWDNGDREVRAIEVGGPPQIYGLKLRLRLTIREHDSAFSTCDLKQARVKLNTEPMSSSLYAADGESHALATGLDLAELMTSHGAVAGKRGHLLHDESRLRKGWCAIFPTESRLAPVVVFLLTRVLPLLNMVYVPATREFDYVVPERAKEQGERLVYVVLLSPDAGISPDADLPAVYVGETGKPRADRFREHLVGHRSSRHVRMHGIRLMPELYPDTGPMSSSVDAKAQERHWAQELQVRGHIVFGGH